MLLGSGLNVLRVLHFLRVWSVLSIKFWFFMFLLCLIYFWLWFLFLVYIRVNPVGSKSSQIFKALFGLPLFFYKRIFSLKRCLANKPSDLLWQISKKEKMVFTEHDLTKKIINNQKIEKQILIKNLFVSYGPILIKKNCIFIYRK
jgi:hypothetical protein